MINLEYHKGEICSLKPTLCQEGYCCDCLIYQESLDSKPAQTELTGIYGKSDQLKELQYLRKAIIAPSTFSLNR